MDKQKREFTGVWIPRMVVEDERLNWTQRALYAEIACFEVCFMSNAFLANRLGVHERKVQEHISYLKELGYIQQVGFDGRQRRLSVLGRHAENGTPDTPKTAPIDNSIENNIDFSANAEEKSFLSEAVEDVTFEVDEDFAPARSLRSRKPAPSTPLVSWAEQRRGRKFTTPIKQRSAILKLKESLDDEDIKALWLETENDEYWKERGLDFTILLSIADKKLTMGNRKDAEKDFKYHMSIMGKMMYDRKPRDEILAYREKHITPLKEKYGFK